jgi:hypothetical protein
MTSISVYCVSQKVLQKHEMKHLPVCLRPGAGTFPVIAFALVHTKITALGIDTLGSVSLVGPVSFKNLTSGSVCPVDGNRRVAMGIAWAAVVASNTEADEAGEGCNLGE